MSEWREVTIGNVCSNVVTGGTPLTKVKEYYVDGKIPWLKTKEVNFSFIKETEYYITELGLKKSSAKLIPKNSVVVAMYGQGDTAGRVAVNKIPLATNQACCNLVIDESISTYMFIYYYLKKSYEELVQRKTGSAQPNLNTKLIKSFGISLPPLPEQKAIAEVLCSLDDKIDLLHRQNKTLEQMAETLFRQWFVEEAGEGWKEGNLGQLGRVVTGKTPSTKNKDYWGKDIPFITPTDFKKYGKYVTNSDRGLSLNGLEKMKNSLIRQKSILVTCIGSDMGKVAISEKDCITNQQINSLVINEEFSSPEYIYQFIKSIYPLLRSIALGGTTMPIINKSEFSKIKVPLPEIDDLVEFESITSSFNDKIKKNTIQIRIFENLRDTLLPKLMSGEVRIVNNE